MQYFLQAVLRYQNLSILVVQFPLYSLQMSHHCLKPLLSFLLHFIEKIPILDHSYMTQLLQVPMMFLLLHLKVLGLLQFFH